MRTGSGCAVGENDQARAEVPPCAHYRVDCRPSPLPIAIRSKEGGGFRKEYSPDGDQLNEVLEQDARAHRRSDHRRRPIERGSTTCAPRRSGAARQCGVERKNGPVRRDRSWSPPPSAFALKRIPPWSPIHGPLAPCSRSGSSKAQTGLQARALRERLSLAAAREKAPSSNPRAEVDGQVETRVPALCARPVSRAPQKQRTNFEPAPEDAHGFRPAAEDPPPPPRTSRRARPSRRYRTREKIYRAPRRVRAHRDAYTNDEPDVPVDPAVGRVRLRRSWRGDRRLSLRAAPTQSRRFRRRATREWPPGSEAWTSVAAGSIALSIACPAHLARAASARTTSSRSSGGNDEADARRGSGRRDG